MINPFKRGYSLVTTIIIMLIIVTLSVSVILMVQAGNLNGKVNVKSFEDKVNVMQIANNYVDLNVNEFVSKYQDMEYDLQTDGNIQTLTNVSDKLVLSINQSNSNIERFQIFDLKDNQLCLIEKQGGVVTLWQYL